MQHSYFNTQHIDKSWRDIINTALSRMNPDYLKNLKQQSSWLPGPEKIFNAFSIPKDNVNVILLGESPYPRPESANGYAFWDAAVGQLWSEMGLSKTVNRATSLRNFIKMLLVADNRLAPDNTSQQAISALDKSSLIDTNQQLFQGLLNRGFLLLNASLVFRTGRVKEDTKAWLPFIEFILDELISQKPTLLLLGRLAEGLNRSKDLEKLPKIIAPHPYNLSFIQHPTIINFFNPLTLLEKNATIGQGP
jgi:uracil-DNA glycosylase